MRYPSRSFNKTGLQTPFWQKPVFLLLMLIAIWICIQIVIARPEHIYNDWFSWRQSDTQSIAINFATKEFNILYPQINWGGDGPGYVQTELQLYTALVALGMKLTGISELPGQIISLTFFVITSLVLFSILRKRFGEFPALVGVGIMLTSRLPVFLSVSVHPDPLCLLFYTLALASFLNYLDTWDRTKWVMCVVWTLLAALIKPTALSLGIIQFIILFTAHPKQLRSPMVWFGWVFVLTGFVFFMIHGYTIYTEYGYTFGTGTGGDSKFPTLRSLTSLKLYAKLAYTTFFWGTGIFGTFAGIYLLLQRKLETIEWALIAGNAVSLLVAMRMTSDRFMGQYYHLLTIILGSWLTAHAVYCYKHKFQGTHKAFILVISILLIIGQYGVHLYLRHVPFEETYAPPAIINTGRKVAEVVKSDDLIIVRSSAYSHTDARWGKRLNNYEDPRILYIAGVRGWVIPSNMKGPINIKDYVLKGARFYVETGSSRDDPELYGWLKENAQLMHHNVHGKIYKFF